MSAYVTKAPPMRPAKSARNVTKTALERVIPFVRQFADVEVDVNKGFATL